MDLTLTLKPTKELEAAVAKELLAKIPETTIASLLSEAKEDEEKECDNERV